MGTATGLLIQSKYFLNTFNMAIFDGPFKLYFAQSQEAEALRLYFELHEIIGDKIRPPRAGAATETGLFVLLYPDEGSFEEKFGTTNSSYEFHFAECSGIAIKGPIWEPEALKHILSLIDSYEEKTPPYFENTAEAQSL